MNNRELDLQVVKILFGKKRYLKGYLFLDSETDNPDKLTKKEQTWFWVHPKDGILIGQAWTIKTMDWLYDHQWHRFCPSTNLNDTQILLNFLHESNIAVTITNTLNSHGMLWFVKIGFGDYASANTMEMAVCEAIILTNKK